MDRGAVSYAVSGETTEWEDILIKKGIKTKEEILVEKGLDPIEYAEAKRRADEKIEIDPDPTIEQKLVNATLEELSDLEEDYDDERILQEYREKRLAELKDRAARDIFGEVYEISKADWVAEVTNASNDCTVIIHLYQDYVALCGVVANVLIDLAQKFKHLKFVKIKATSAVENWRDELLPTLFIYQEGSLKHQLIGAQALGGAHLQTENLEWKLAQLGILETEMEEEPHQHNFKMKTIEKGRSEFVVQRSEYDDDSDDY
mmetsp:Transcript_27674/g.35778  ORF Transcript_27674/g.35778 Transcript_27674/m.35778 type:complete len:260 (-) Transcript_27674:299-1078(-)